MALATKGERKTEHNQPFLLGTLGRVWPLPSISQNPQTQLQLFSSQLFPSLLAMATCAGWSVTTTPAPLRHIASEAQRNAVAETTSNAALPEMLFATAELKIQHGETNATLTFCAQDALKEWARENAKAPDVPIAAKWQESRRGTAAFDEAKPPRVYDWTFTTPYAGTLEGGTFQATSSKKINREMLLARDPILFYDEVELYSSELDDTGAVNCSVKVRVMPRCWYVLCRLWLRVDGALVRLRESRIFCSADDPKTVVRETTWHEGTPETLAKAGAPSDVRGGASSPYGDADATAQALGAVAPAAVVKHIVESAEL